MCLHFGILMHFGYGRDTVVKDADEIAVQSSSWDPQMHDIT